MKLDYRDLGERLEITIRGAIEGDRCDCLRHYWERYGADRHREIHVDLSAVEHVDEQGAAELDSQVRQAKAGGARVIFRTPSVEANKFWPGS